MCLPLILSTTLSASGIQMEVLAFDTHFAQAGFQAGRLTRLEEGRFSVQRRLTKRLQLVVARVGVAPVVAVENAAALCALLGKVHGRILWDGCYPRGE